MAVPKKRKGSSAQGHRRSNWKATKPEITKCTNCGEVALTHTVCKACGYYKGKAVSIKSPGYVETTAEVKKPAKKSAKKTETATKTKKSSTTKKEKETKVDEVKVEEVTDAVETKAEEPVEDKTEKTEE